MIKFTSTGEKTTLIGLGVSEENIRRLKNGQPIFIKGKELGFDWLEIIIFYGRDEDELIKTVRNIGASIDQVIDRRSDKKTRPCSFCKQPIPDSGIFGLPTYTDVPENHSIDCPVREIMEVSLEEDL